MKALKCPTCGAPLPTSAEARVRCLSCGNMIDMESPRGGPQAKVQSNVKHYERRHYTSGQGPYRVEHDETSFSGSFSAHVEGPVDEVRIEGPGVFLHAGSAPAGGTPNNRAAATEQADRHRTAGAPAGSVPYEEESSYRYVEYSPLLEPLKHNKRLLLAILVGGACFACPLLSFLVIRMVVR